MASSLVAFNQTLRKIESTIDLSQIASDSLPIWPLLKIFLYGNIVRDHPTDGNLANPKNRLKGQLRRLQTLKKFFRQAATTQQILPSNLDVLLFSRKESLIQIDGTTYDKLFDPLVSQIRKNTDQPLKTLSLIYNSDHETFTVDENKWLLKPYFLRLKLKAFFQDKLFPRWPNGPLEEFLALLKQDYPDLDTRALLKKFRLHLRYFSLCQKFYTTLLKQTQPKLIALACYYSLEGFALIAAAKQENIPTCDVQHGAQSPIHPAYSGWATVLTKAKRLLPDFFLTWKSNGAQFLQNDITPGVANPIAFATGYLWNSFCDRYFATFNQKMLAIHSKTLLNGNPNVLVSLQWGDSHHFGFADEVLQVMRQSQDQINWLVRLHPVQLQDLSHHLKKLESLGLPSQNVEAWSRLPLNFLFRHVAAHITLFSSICLEAADYGIPSICLNADEGARFYPELVTDGLVLLRSNKKSFQQTLSHLLAQPRSVSQHTQTSAESANELANFLKQIDASWRMIV